VRSYFKGGTILSRAKKKTRRELNIEKYDAVNSEKKLVRGLETKC